MRNPSDTSTNQRALDHPSATTSVSDATRVEKAEPMTPWSADGKSTRTQQGQADEPKEDAGDSANRSQSKTLDLDNEAQKQEASSKASTKTGGDGVSTFCGQYAGGSDYIPRK